MKARVLKPKTLEQGKLSIIDQVNELYLSKTSSNVSSSSSSTLKSLANRKLPVNLMLGLSLFTGGVSQNMKNRCSEFTSPRLSVSIEQPVNVPNSASEGVTSTNSLETKPDSLLVTESSKVANVSKYLTAARLTNKSHGADQDRYAAINEKVEKNIRILQVEDYKIFQMIKKVQMIGGVSMTLSVPAFFMSVFAKGVSNNAKLALMKSILLFMVGTGGVLTHYNMKYSNFLHHLNQKYFYAATLKDIQNPKLIKTNVPKSLVFESAGWNLRNKLPFVSKKREENIKSKDYL